MKIKKGDIVRYNNYRKRSFQAPDRVYQRKGVVVSVSESEIAKVWWEGRSSPSTMHVVWLEVSHDKSLMCIQCGNKLSGDDIICESHFI